jgi:hypothetical protein
MERLGKILVFVHLGLSLLLASAAMALYFNRTDWTAQKGKDGKPDGELVGRIAEYDDLAKTGIWPAEKRLLSNREQLEANERSRPYERNWYAQQLAILRGDVAGPIQQLARGPDGSVLFDPTFGQQGRTNILQMGPVQAKDRDGKPLELKSLVVYAREIGRKVDDLITETANLKKEADRDAAATNQLKGPKGLHARLLFEKHKYDQVVEEYKAIRPKWLNNTVELRELEELRQRLDERVRQLTTTKVSSRP